MPYTREQEELIRSAWQTVSESGVLRGTLNAKRLFDYLVDRHLKSPGTVESEKELGEHALGIVGYTTADGAVRTAKTTLLDKLARYYNEQGRQDPVIFRIPKGYALSVEFRDLSDVRSTVAGPPVNVTADSNVHAREEQEDQIEPRPLKPLRISDNPDLVSAAPPAAQSALKKHWRWIVAVVLGLSVLAWWFSLRTHEGFTNLRSGSVVSTTQDVMGVGPRVSGNRYLIVEPQVGNHPLFVQGKIEASGASDWLIRAHFGDVSTPDGTTFRVFVLSTASDLPNSEIATLPQDGKLHFDVQVTLRK